MTEVTSRRTEVSVTVNGEFIAQNQKRLCYTHCVQ